MTEAALSISDLNLSFRGVRVLEEINLELGQGEFLGIIGPNGAGKTILLKTILGLIKPDSGTIRVFGGSLSKQPGIVGYVPQYAKFDHDFPISVLDAVCMGRLAHAKLLGPYSWHDRSIAEGALKKVGLYEFKEKQLGRLSGGQIQRVLIARALACQPKILFLDEPTASLDTPIGSTVYQLLEELSEDMTIILVSHDIGVISKHVTSIACMNKRLHYHHSKEINPTVLEEVYGCPVDLLAHGHAHRVLGKHEDHEH
ncbi:MAG: ABC transporter [Proteobacteria bacterium]|nr:MAG: ABC transporter [Pseudomonadota bacterium]